MTGIQANGYSIYFNENGYKELNSLLAKNNYSTLFLLVDSNTNDLCSSLFLSHIETESPIEIIEFEAGETHKNIETCTEIWNVLTELGADRKSIILNLGGGVVSDLGGFIAATFKRGIDFINIPTSLLAMVDAAVGGKTGIDLGTIKNQIGVFNVPEMVLIDVRFLETLPPNEMRSGLAEMLKHGLIYDRNYWNLFLDLSKQNFDVLENLIYQSVVIKNTIVMEDPNEKGIRKILNFGHTLGHAIESYFLENTSKNNLLHGEAIAIGMILESHISKNKKLLSNSDYFEIKKTINAIFETVIFDKKDVEGILNLLIHDKKNEYGSVKFTLINGIGSAIFNQNADNEMIMKAFEDYKS
jgi:3-dehydroquinate synthase